MKTNTKRIKITTLEDGRFLVINEVQNIQFIADDVTELIAALKEMEELSKI